MARVVDKKLGYNDKIQLVRVCFEGEGWDCPFPRMRAWLARHGCRIKSKGYLLHLRSLVRKAYRPDWMRLAGRVPTKGRGHLGWRGRMTKECFQELGWRCGARAMAEWFALRGISMSDSALLSLRSSVRGQRRLRLSRRRMA